MQEPLYAPTGQPIVGIRVALKATRMLQVGLCSLTGQVRFENPARENLVVDWETEQSLLEDPHGLVYVDAREHLWREHQLVPHSQLGAPSHENVACRAA
jgi:hypothetical protein